MFWLTIVFMLIQVTHQYNSYNQKYCYTFPSRYCVLCGCYKTEETQHTLSCGENEVIRMEAEGHPMETSHYQLQSPSSFCYLTSNRPCNTGFDDTDVVTTYTDRVAVYKLCTLQNTCTFTVKPVDSGDAKLVRYPYVCEEDIISMSNPVSLQVTDPVLYFTGKDHVGENINCGCTITPSDQQTMELEIFYINGDNMCNRVRFNSLDVIQCNNNTQLYTNKIQVDDDVLNITIQDITATGDDVLYFKVHGNNLRVTCSGCLLITDSSTTPSITMSSSNAVDLSQNTDIQESTTIISSDSSNTVDDSTESTTTSNTAITTSSTTSNTAITTSSSNTVDLSQNTGTTSTGESSNTVDDSIESTTISNTAITTSSTTSNTAITMSSSNIVDLSQNTTTMFTSESNDTVDSTKGSTTVGSRSNEEGFISLVEHEEKMNDMYIMFGAILAAVIIVNIVGVGIFCFIRRRNTTDKLSMIPH